MFTHLSVLECIPTHGKLSLIVNAPSNNTSGRWIVGLVFRRYTHVAPYSPSSLADLWSKDLGPS